MRWKALVSWLRPFFFFFFFLVSPYQTIEISLGQPSPAPPHINYFLRRWTQVSQPVYRSVPVVTTMFSAAKYSKSCRLYWHSWCIVILYIKFIRSCGSVFGVFLPSDSLQRVCFTRKTTKSSVKRLYNQ